MQLAIGADNIKWLDYPRKYILVFSMFGWFFPVLTLIPAHIIGRIFVIVMGQPMTWISQANSHLLFFELPSLAFIMIVSPKNHDSHPFLRYS